MRDLLADIRPSCTYDTVLLIQSGAATRRTRLQVGRGRPLTTRISPSQLTLVNMDATRFLPGTHRPKLMLPSSELVSLTIPLCCVPTIFYFIRTWSEVPTLFSTPVTDTWSGGIAFSYFPTADNYGMITLSSDNSTVETTTDFTNLARQLSNVTLPTTPTQSNVTTAAAPSCPGQSAAFNASSTLPPTPDETVCNCLMSKAFSCIRTDATAQEPVVIGELLDYGCSLLGQAGGSANCDAIAGNGGSGSYGAISFCAPGTLSLLASFLFTASVSVVVLLEPDSAGYRLIIVPDVKLSYVFSAYYVSQGYDAQACE